MLAFWLGGAASTPGIPIPPQVDLAAGIPWPWMRTVEVRKLLEELEGVLDEEELPVILACIWIVLWHDLN